MANVWKRHAEETYPWFFRNPSSAASVSFLFTIAVIVLSIVLLIVYTSVSNDPTPDSIAGYGYAIAGTIFMFLAALSYTHYRRSRKRGVGKLNGALCWHVSFGIIALVLLCLHTFGNTNPRSGTYALYGMIALVISGIIGRLFDRILPKLIAQQVKRALTEQGEDRVEHHTRTIQSIVTYHTEEVHSLNTQQRTTPSEAKILSQQPLTTSWDLAYISLEETPQEIAQNEEQYRFVPSRKSNLSRPEMLMPGVQEHFTELHHVQSALRREAYYRAIIRYWRFGHVVLTIITVGLTLWHLEYASTLLIPLFLK